RVQGGRSLQSGQACGGIAGEIESTRVGEPVERVRRFRVRGLGQERDGFGDTARGEEVRPVFEGFGGRGERGLGALGRGRRRIPRYREEPGIRRWARLAGAG